MRKRDLVIGDPYYQAWQDYSRVWRRSLFLIIVLFYCVNFVLLWIVGTMFPMAPKWVLPICLALGTAPAVIVSQAPIQWPCPRCGKPFHKTKWGYSGFARRCMHCRLPKWAPGG